MRGIKPSVALAAFGVVGVAVWASAFYDSSGSQMATAAGRVLKALDKEQLARATFEFESPERVNWHFIPRERKGLPLRELEFRHRESWRHVRRPTPFRAS